MKIFTFSHFPLSKKNSFCGNYMRKYDTCLERVVVSHKMINGNKHLQCESGLFLIYFEINK